MLKHNLQETNGRHAKRLVHVTGRFLLGGTHILDTKVDFD